MPWISRKELDALRGSSAELLEDQRHTNNVLAHILDRLNDLPSRLVESVREAGLADVLARATIKADAEAQPPSIQAADRMRVQEQRERESQTR